MDSVVRLSRLLANGERLLEQTTNRSSKPPNFQEIYQTWWSNSFQDLPGDLREEFARISTSISQIKEPNFWFSVSLDLKDQCDILRAARRRLWQPISSFPSVRQTITQVCRTAYNRDTLKDLFVICGCEPGWYIPPTEPEPKAKAEHTTRGWLDGIILFAPDQEAAILQKLCKHILAKPGLPEKHHQPLRSALELFEQAVANPLDSYQLHPQVVAFARPLMANKLYDDAILKVCTALEHTIRTQSQIDEHSSKLIREAFAPNAPRIRVAELQAEQGGWMNFYVATMQVLRHPRAHRPHNAMSEQEAIEWLHLLSALFRVLDTAEIRLPTDDTA